MSKNTGGAVFPIGDHSKYNAHSGMDLRDYFAAKAMPKAFEGFGRQARYTGDRTPPAQECARRAYAMADAMIAEREES